MPINRTTVNRPYGLDLQTDAKSKGHLKARAGPVARVRTSEKVIASRIDGNLYEGFFRGYTRKQWGPDPSDLDKSVTNRVPTRCNVDDLYVTDSCRAVPAKGYTYMLKKMLDHSGITNETSVDFDDLRSNTMCHELIFTSPFDEYLGPQFGILTRQNLIFTYWMVDWE